MKWKIICVMLSLCSLLFAKEFYFKITQELICADDNNIEIVVPLGTILKNSNIQFGGSQLRFTYDEKQLFTMDLSSIIPLYSDDLLDADLLSNFCDKKTSSWIDTRCYEPLISNNRNILLTYFPYLEQENYRVINEVHGLFFEENEWYKLINARDYTWSIYNCLISSTLNSKWCFPIINIKKNVNSYRITVLRSYVYMDNESSYIHKRKINYDWLRIPKKEMFDLIFIIDGDYMDIFVESTDIHFATLVHVSKKSVEQLDKLIQGD